MHRTTAFQAFRHGVGVGIVPGDLWDLVGKQFGQFTVAAPEIQDSLGTVFQDHACQGRVQELAYSPWIHRAPELIQTRQLRQVRFVQ